MKSSLTSITFRPKSMEEIVALVKKAELDAIEWGGDVHVAPGDREAAKKAYTLCKENGIEISAYGSYFRAKPEEDFAPVLESALAMEAPVIRVWAGSGFGNSENCSEDDRKRFTEKLENAALAAKNHGITVATEFHCSTLTDTLASTVQLLKDAPDLRTYWQPRTHPAQSVAEDLSDVQTLAEKIINIHVFRWIGNDRMPLSQGYDLWTQFMDAVNQYTKAEYAAIEFVANDTDAQFLEDAAVLRRLVAQTQ